MTRRAFEYSDYEPSDHRVDGEAVLSSLVLLVIFLAAMLTVG